MIENFQSFGGQKWRAREARVGSRLPYRRHIDEVTITTDGGHLIQIIELQGISVETLEDSELNYRKLVRSTILRAAANANLTVMHHIVREQTEAVSDGLFSDPFCSILHQAWQETLAARKLYRNALFLTLVLGPAAQDVRSAWPFGQSGGGVPAQMEARLGAMHAACEAIVSALAPYGAKVASIYAGKNGLYSRPAEILAGLVNGIAQPVLLPTGKLGDAMCSARLIFGFDAMETRRSAGRERRFSAAVALKDYPARSTPGMLDGVMRLPFELTLSESFSFLEPQLALRRMSTVLRRLRAADSDAKSLLGELGQAKDDVATGRVSYGRHHLSILVHGDTIDELNLGVASVSAALAEAGAICVREDINLEPTFWAQLPGNDKFIARTGLISTTNFASFASLHNHAPGKSSGNHWGQSVTVLETTANGPYHFNWHSGDLGNFTLIGPSGSGKTVLLTFLLAQAQKFEPRTIYFDKDRGAEIFIRATSGRYDLLRPGSPSGLNPLQLPDSPEARSFLAAWLAQLVTDSSAPLDVDDRATIADAVAANFTQPPEFRRLRYLRQMFSGSRRAHSGDLAARLASWCEGGEHSWVFDNQTDQLDLAVQRFGFDMTKLLDMPIVRTPTMMYLFHRIEQQLDGTPTIIVIDEAWKALDDEVFVRRLRDWEKTIRKRNGIVGFCTQSASDAVESRISSAIIEQAATHIFMPNSRALERDYVQGFGLSRQEFELVRSLSETSRCFLVKQADHSVVARLDLHGHMGLTKVLAANERSVRQLDRIREEVGDQPCDWLPQFAGITLGAGHWQC